MEKRRIIHSVQFLLLTVAFTAGCEPNRTPALTLVSDAETIPPMPEALATLTVEGPTPSSDGEPAQTRSPTAVPTIPETTASPEESHWDIIALAAGGEHTCALIGDAEFGDGYIQCWGKNDFGQLGDDTTTDSNRPVDLYWGGGDGIFRGVTAGWGHSCGFGDFLDEPVGGVYCWGYNKNGELGDGTDSNSPVNEYQVRVWGLHGVVAMAAGDDHTCALLGNGSVKCWGLNDSGQLGDGTTNSSNTPVEVKYLTGGVVSITAGWGHTCALIQDGGVRCWGDNQYGQLGDGTSVPYRAERGIVAGLPNDIVAIAAGGGHTCALRSSSQVLCWGNNQYGELGDGTSSNRNLP
ncbi:MAG: hypothetical protein JW929_05500, partial [Anaerolineales bacterium]|nr:hypothetical protein [Anaerolineales bacterium]